MTVLTVLQDSSPILREKSEPIEVFDDGVRDLSAHMNDTLQQHRALGLAAVQVGVPIRLMLVRIAGVGVVAMANPRLIRTLNREAVMKEGCLSIGQGFDKRMVARPAKCDVAWQNLEGDAKEGSFSGMDARVILHELDHLDGKLMTDLPRARG